MVVRVLHPPFKGAFGHYPIFGFGIRSFVAFLTPLNINISGQRNLLRCVLAIILLVVSKRVRTAWCYARGRLGFFYQNRKHWPK